VISPGGVGFDIACGVRLLAADLSRDELVPVMDRVMDRLAALIPCGAGRGGLWHMRGRAQLDKLLAGGAGYAIACGHGGQRTWAAARTAVSWKTPAWHRSAAARSTADCSRSAASVQGTISLRYRRWTGSFSQRRRGRSGWPKGRSAS
jgi:RNA-splicing ligase RtcB